MTDRRRNLIILTVVAALLLAALAVIVPGLPSSKPTRFNKVTGDAIDRTMDIMRKRVDNLGVAEPEIQRTGESQIDVSLPDVKNADQAQQQVGTTAQLYFYDWEKSVVGANGKPDPTNPNVTGGPSAGTPGAG